MGSDAAHPGRPRSEDARVAVLHAVDDLLLEVGYGALTMKAIAERAGVSRQTVYRWWSTKAEVLLEASAFDARHELDVPVLDDTIEDLLAYVRALVAFLVDSPAGASYRALLGAAQGDSAVAALLASADLLGDSAGAVIDRALGDRLAIPRDRATALLVGPVFFWVLSGRPAAGLDPRSVVDDLLAAAGSGEVSPPGRRGDGPEVR